MTSPNPGKDTPITAEDTKPKVSATQAPLARFLETTFDDDNDDDVSVCSDDVTALVQTSEEKKQSHVDAVVEIVTDLKSQKSATAHSGNSTVPSKLHL